MTWEDVSNWFSFFYDYFIQHGMANAMAKTLATFLNFVVVVLVVILLDILARKIIVQVFRRFSVRSRTTFDDFLVSSNFPRFMAHYVPVVVLRILEPQLFKYFTGFTDVFMRLTDIYIVVLTVLVFRSIMRSTLNWLNPGVFGISRF